MCLGAWSCEGVLGRVCRATYYTSTENKVQFEFIKSAAGIRKLILMS